MKYQTIKLNFKQKNKLEYIISNNNYNVRPKAKVKAKVILLKAEGKSINEIIKETKVSKRTIINYVKEYNNYNNDIDRMLFFHKNNYKCSYLNTIKPSLLEEFKNNPPITYKEATLRIKQLYTINISESAVRRYLNKHYIYTSNSRLRNSKKRR